MKQFYRVEADVNLDSIYNNLVNTKKIINKDTKLMAIIKADGYGHGAVAIVRAVDDIVDAYGVSNIDEALEVRNNTDKMILILGYTAVKQFKYVIKYDITQTIYSYEFAKELSMQAIKRGKVAKVHIKIDTGMGRIGFKPNKDSIKEIKDIFSLEGIEVTGIFTHFAKADESDKTFANEQISRFTDFVKELESNGMHFATKHVSNSASIIDLPQVNFDMVRSGISTYGLYPSSEVDSGAIALEPAMEIKACISFIKEVEAGVGISYGSTYVTSRPTKIATIPVGYADGYPRNLSNKGFVLINGKRAPILGRVCMDQFMVDITDIEGVNYESEVTLLGRDGDEFISVEELSELAGTFNYEFVCDIGKRVPRVFLRNGKNVGMQDFSKSYLATYSLEDDI